MSLLLVRHGQAAFASEDYDSLSDLGHEQARRLGQWLARHRRGFDVVIHGGMRRHRATLDALLGELPGSPPARVDPRLAEFDHGAVFGAYLAAAPDHPGAAAMRERRLDAGLAIMDFLRAALRAWQSGGLDCGGESWSAFSTRCRAAGRDLAALAADGAEVLVISSAGTIAQITAYALDVPDARSVELNLTLRNSAFCELQPTGDTVLLTAWNHLPHLADARELWTYL